MQAPPPKKKKKSPQIRSFHIHFLCSCHLWWENKHCFIKPSESGWVKSGICTKQINITQEDPIYNITVTMGAWQLAGQIFNTTLSQGQGPDYPNITEPKPWFISEGTMILYTTLRTICHSVIYFHSHTESSDLKRGSNCRNLIVIYWCFMFISWIPLAHLS